MFHVTIILYFFSRNVVTRAPCMILLYKHSGISMYTIEPRGIKCIMQCIDPSGGDVTSRHPLQTAAATATTTVKLLGAPLWCDGGERAGCGCGGWRSSETKGRVERARCWEDPYGGGGGGGEGSSASRLAAPRRRPCLIRRVYVIIRYDADGVRRARKT